MAEPINHRAAPVKRDINGGDLLSHRAGVRLAEVINQETADGHFGADIDEDSDDAENEMTLLPDADGVPCVRIFHRRRIFDAGNFRQLEERDGQRQGDEHSADNQIRQLHGCGLLDAIDVESGSAEPLHFHRAERHRTENQKTAEIGRDKCAKRVKGLREIEAAGCGLRRAEDGDIGVGGDLKRGHAGRDDNQRREKEGEGWQAGRGDEHQRAERHHK
jgi:hypothetical protein